jgi:hypothetical protein
VNNQKNLIGTKISRPAYQISRLLISKVNNTLNEELSFAKAVDLGQSLTRLFPNNKERIIRYTDYVDDDGLPCLSVNFQSNDSMERKLKSVKVTEFSKQCLSDSAKIFTCTVGDNVLTDMSESGQLIRNYFVTGSLFNLFMSVSAEKLVIDVSPDDVSSKSVFYNVIAYSNGIVQVIGCDWFISENDIRISDLFRFRYEFEDGSKWLDVGDLLYDDLNSNHNLNVNYERPSGILQAMEEELGSYEFDYDDLGDL